MIPNRDDFIGRWSENLGYSPDLSRDTVLHFHSDGELTIHIGSERIAAGWECPSPGRLVLINENGHHLGPYSVNIEKRVLPLGTFDILVSDGSLIPFDRRQFTRMEPLLEQSLSEAES